jgi:antitoxin VapB
MSLNIKNEEAHRLAQRLAQLTGESMTTAVTRAVQERLERVQRRRGNGQLDRILKISRACAARLKGTSLPDHGHLLYDEKGLPK